MSLTPDQEKRLLAAAIRRKEALQRDKAMDPFVPDSRPAAYQDEVFKDINDYPTRVLIWGNQTGKSQCGGRELSWILENKHPYLKRPKSWDGRPIGAIVMGKVGEQVETLLWKEKIKPFLTPGTYKEVRTGNSLQRVDAVDGSWTILLMSHHNAEEARQKAQGFSYQYVWLDEMPTSLSLIAELESRTIAKDGKLLITFTPLIRNAEIKSWVEGLDPTIGKRYKAGMLDNPIYSDRKEEILKRYANYPEAERNARLYGDWLVGDLGVYDFDAARDLVHAPEGYGPDWKHLYAVDPASSGKSGYAVFAQRPSDDQWFLVRTGYYKEKVPTKNVERSEQNVAGHRVIRRVADSHETWFIQQAYSMGYSYLMPHRKNERKDELIKQLQNVIHTKRVLIVEGQEDFNKEISTCMYSEKDSGKIVNATSYHILDAVQYGVDMIPQLNKKPAEPLDADPVVQDGKEIRRAWAKEKKRKALLDKMSRSRRFNRGLSSWRA